ncbi:hypothetical protein TNCV_4851791 [Trichonephila clavipes]|nr:hypothetical protein TNCV_4851791 [Trichonephila clavipes]
MMDAQTTTVLRGRAKAAFSRTQHFIEEDDHKLLTKMISPSEIKTSGNSRVSSLGSTPASPSETLEQGCIEEVYACWCTLVSALGSSPAPPLEILEQGCTEEVAALWGLLSS